MIIRSPRWPLRLAALLLTASLTLTSATQVHKEGLCAMRGQVPSPLLRRDSKFGKCGSLDVFGKQLPCPDNGEAEDVCPYGGWRVTCSRRTHYGLNLFRCAGTYGRRGKSAVRPNKSMICPRISTSQDQFSPHVPHANTTFTIFSVHLHVPRTNLSSSMSPQPRDLPRARRKG